MTDDPFHSPPLWPDAAETGRTIRQTVEQGEAGARTLSEAFRTAGEAISDSLERAARTGELSFERMAQSILHDLAELALDRLVLDRLPALAAPAGLLDGVLGQRAEGGPVLAGERYLVGERGPEVFTPSVSGTVHAQPGAVAPVSVTIIAQGAPLEAVRRSERQISAAVARAVQQGRASL